MGKTYRNGGPLPDTSIVARRLVFLQVWRQNKRRRDDIGSDSDVEIKVAVVWHSNNFLTELAKVRRWRQLDIDGGMEQQRNKCRIRQN